MTTTEITAEITRRCWVFGVSVLVAPTDAVDCDGRLVSGYFDENIPTLKVAGAFPGWIGTLLHEYAHLTQWAEDCEVWRRCKAAEQHADIDAWLAGQSQRGIRATIEATRELEADNERRTVRLMRELGAPVDIADYSRRANAYIHFHNVMLETRKWYRPDRRPYYTPEVSALCNPTIDTDFSKTPAVLAAALRTCV